MHKATCGKCNGKGNLKHFKHVEGGICFSCNGKGFKLTKLKPQEPQHFLLWMIQDGEWVHCSHAKNKKSAEKWCRLGGERKFTVA